MVLLPATINLATGAIPESWKPYLPWTWLLVPILALPALIVEIRHQKQLSAPSRHAGRAPAAPAVLVEAGVRPGAQTEGLVWNIPAPSRTFTGRHSDLNAIRKAVTAERAASGCARLALWGMAGVGKTQLALKYAERARKAAETKLARRSADAGANTGSETKPKLSVGWLMPASDRLVAVAELAELADRLGVGDEDQERACRRAVDALAGRADWLLIFDAAPGPAVLEGLIPAGRGRVLITSTNPAWESTARPCPIAEFDVKQSIAFLRARRHPESTAAAEAELPPAEQKALEEVAAELNGLPLALEQAGAYCAVNGLSWRSFLERYRADLAGILGARGPSGHPLPLTVTWRMTLREIDRRNPAAGQLLRLMAFLGPAPIPRELVTRAVSSLPRALRRANAGTNLQTADEMIAAVTTRSLARWSTDPSDHDEPRLVMHQLLQAVIREEIRLPSTAPPNAATALATLLPRRGGRWPSARWISCAVDLLRAATPDDARDHRAQGRFLTLLPHALTVLAHAERLEILSSPLADLQHAYGDYLDLRRQDATARALLEGAFAYRSRRLGTSHPDTLATMTVLAFALHRDPSQHPRARQLAQQAVTGYRNLYGDDHRATLKAKTALAAVMFSQGQLGEACELGEQVLAGQRRVLGEDGPHTLASMANLAAVYHALGRLAEACELGEQALAGRRRVLGEDHPNTLMSMNNIAAVYRNLGRLAEACELGEQALAGRRRVLGEDHPHTLMSMYNLAIAYHALGRLAEACELGEQALAGRRRVLGEDHPNTLMSMNNLAIAYRDLGRLAEARELGEQALAGRRRVLGEDHRHTLKSMNNLADIERLISERTEDE
ncbi:FxSxx-COOH system tetratricopeptide repeat protein [Nonomuraea sp. NPDC050328]|uniref:FxSxx-COOH system tetratricopeptide repeat protein n=1 Tax=Nonomuraea sp. NPDC050328 TaxID=3364361 RepID=UPI00378AD79E